MGLINSAMGGAPETVGRQMADERKTQPQKSIADHEAVLAAKRTEVLEELRREFDLKNQQQPVEQGVTETEAAERRANPELGTVDKVTQSVDGALADFIKTTAPADTGEVLGNAGGVMVGDEPGKRK